MNTMELSIAVLFYPTDAFYYIKSKKKTINYFSCIFLLFAILTVRIITIYIVHFPIAAIHPRDANIWLEIVKFILPVITWVVSCYAITSISDGETLLGEGFAATAYAMVPYVAFSIPLALLSRVMGRSLLLLYNSLNVILLAWVLLIIFLSVKTLNDYSTGQTIKVCFLGLIMMLLIWAVLILLFALTSQFFQFVLDIVLEIKMIFMN